MQQSEVFHAMREGWNQDHWTKWALQSSDGERRCLLGQMSHVMTGDALNIHKQIFEYNVSEPIRTLAKTIRSIFPARPDRYGCTGETCNTVAAFNNHEDTDFGDIELVLKEAERVALEAEGALA